MENYRDSALHNEGKMKMEARVQKIMDDINRSIKKVQVLPVVDAVKEEVRKRFSLNPESVCGTVIENTGGIIIEDWIRLYGSGEVNVIARNELCPFEEFVVGEDILGGLYVYLENGNIGYFAPDCLELEDMEIRYPQFLYWCLHGDTDTFYSDYRWEGWQQEVAKLGYDEGVAFYPFLWAEAESFESRMRKVVPINEIIGLEFDYLKQI